MRVSSIPILLIYFGFILAIPFAYSAAIQRGGCSLTLNAEADDVVWVTLKSGKDGTIKAEGDPKSSGSDRFENPFKANPGDILRVRAIDTTPCAAGFGKAMVSNTGAIEGYEQAAIEASENSILAAPIALPNTPFGMKVTKEGKQVTVNKIATYFDDNEKIWKYPQGCGAPYYYPNPNSFPDHYKPVYETIDWYKPAVVVKEGDWSDDGVYRNPVIEKNPAKGKVIYDSGDITLNHQCKCKKIGTDSLTIQGTSAGILNGEFVELYDFCTDGTVDQLTGFPSEFVIDLSSDMYIPSYFDPKALKWYPSPNGIARKELTYVAKGSCSGGETGPLEISVKGCPQGSKCVAGSCSCGDSDRTGKYSRIDIKGTTAGFDYGNALTHTDFCVTFFEDEQNKGAFYPYTTNFKSVEIPCPPGEEGKGPCYRAVPQENKIMDLPSFESLQKKWSSGGDAAYQGIKKLATYDGSGNNVGNAVIEGDCVYDKSVKLSMAPCAQSCKDGACVPYEGVKVDVYPARDEGKKREPGQPISEPSINEREAVVCRATFTDAPKNIYVHMVKEINGVKSAYVVRGVAPPHCKINPNSAECMRYVQCKETNAGVTCVSLIDPVEGSGFPYPQVEKIPFDFDGRKWNQRALLSCEVEVDGKRYSSQNKVRVRGNEKNKDFYPQKSVFLVPFNGWYHDVLSILPAAIWEDRQDRYWCSHPKTSDDKEVGDKCYYPFLVYQKEDALYDIESIRYFINQQYNSPPQGSDVTIFSIGKFLSDFGINAKEIKELSPSDVLNENYFWKEFSTVVVANLDTSFYNEAILGAQLASYLNAPLIFASDRATSVWINLFKNPSKKFSVIFMPGVEQGVIEDIAKNGHFLVKYENGVFSYNDGKPEPTFKQEEDVQKALQIHKRIEKIMITNPIDQLSAFCENRLSFQGLPALKEWYCRTSLTAPILAAGRDWLPTFVYTTRSAPGIFFSSNSQQQGSGTKGGEEKEAGQTETDSTKADAASSPPSNPEEEIVSIATKQIQPQVYSILSSFKPKYVLFLAAPKAIPLSKMRGNYDLQRLSLDRSYVDQNLDGKEDIPFGRLYTKTITGTSAYMNRILSNTQQEKNTFLSVAHSFEGLQTHFDTLDMQLPSLGYDEADCYLAFDPLGRCQKGVPPSPYDSYKGKKVVYYDDHGSSNQWSSTIPAKDIPQLSSSLVISDACLTNDYYNSPDGYVFGPEAIEKGALSYLGGVGTTAAREGHILQSGIGEDLFRLVVSERKLDLGTALKELYQGLTPVSSDYLLLGDPTFTPSIPKFSYPYILRHDLQDNPTLGSSFSFQVSDQDGPDNVGDIKVLITRKEDNVVKEISPKCEKRSDHWSCTMAFNNPSLLQKDLLVEMRAYDKKNEKYGAVFQDVKKIKVIEISIVECRMGISGVEGTCTVHIKVQKDNLGDVKFTKLEGGIINPPYPQHEGCTWSDYNREYRCKFTFTPEDPGDYKIKVDAETKSVDDAGKPYPDDETTTFRASPIEVTIVSCAESLDHQRWDCKVDVKTKKGDLGKAALSSISGPAIAPPEPQGACVWNEERGLNVCTFLFTLPKVGKYSLVFSAFTHSIDPKDGKPFFDMTNFEKDLNPIKILWIECSASSIYPAINQEIVCTTTLYVDPAQWGDAMFSVLEGGSYEPTPITTNCKQDGQEKTGIVLRPSYKCETKFTPKSAGTYRIEMKASTKPTDGTQPLTGTVETTLTIKAISIKSFTCEGNVIGVVSRCYAEIPGAENTLGSTTLRAENGVIDQESVPGNCEWSKYEWSDNLGAYLCEFRFTPRQNGNHLIKVTAASLLTDAANNPFTTEHEREITVGSILVTLSRWTPFIVGRKSTIEFTVRAEKSSFDKATLHRKSGADVDVLTPQAQCVWDETYSFFNCNIEIVPKTVGPITLEVTASQKEPAGNPPVSESSIYDSVSALKISSNLCSPPIIGKEVKCSAYVYAAKDKFTGVTIKKENGLDVEIPNAEASCSWDETLRLFICGYSFTPKGSGKLHLLLTAELQSQGGNPVKETLPLRFETSAPLIKEFYCNNLAAGFESSCTATVLVAQDELESASLKERLGRIVPEEPEGDCRWSTAEGGFSSCMFKFKPKSAGPIELTASASLKNQAEPISSTIGVEVSDMVINPFYCGTLKVGVQNQCSIRVKVPKDAFKEAFVEWVGGSQIQPAKPLGDCKWEEKDSVYYCSFLLTPKTVGDLRINYVAIAKINDADVIKKVPGIIPMGSWSIGYFDCGNPSIGGESRCTVGLEIPKNAFAKATIEKVDGPDIKISKPELATGDCTWNERNDFAQCTFKVSFFEPATYRLQTRILLQDSSIPSEGLKAFETIELPHVKIREVQISHAVVNAPLQVKGIILAYKGNLKKATLETGGTATADLPQVEGTCLSGNENDYDCDFSVFPRSTGQLALKMTAWGKQPEDNPPTDKKELTLEVEEVSIYYSCPFEGKIGQESVCYIKVNRDKKYNPMITYERLDGGKTEPEKPMLDCQDKSEYERVCFLPFTPRELGRYEFLFTVSGTPVNGVPQERKFKGSTEVKP